MKTLFFGLVLAAVMIGCDRSNPADQSEQADLFSEESMLMFASAANDDPGLQSPNAGMHNGPRHKKMIRHLTRFLDLTEEQQAALQQLADAMFTELSAIRDRVQAGDLTRDDARPLIHDLRTQFMEAVRALLTPTQQTKLDEWEQNRWEKRQRRMQHFGG